MEKNYEEYVAGLMEKARAAQKVINDYSQEQVDELVKAIMKSDRTYEEVLEFLNAGSEDEEEV